MINIKSMGYIRVASTDLSAWTTFAGKVLGLAEGRGPNPENQYWRIDAVSARLVVFPADVDQLDATGWEVADHVALQNAREHLKEAGVVFEEGTGDEHLCAPRKFPEQRGHGPAEHGLDDVVPQELVAELAGDAQSNRRSVRSGQLPAAHSVGEKGLRVPGVGHVQAIPETLLERKEDDVLCARPDTHEVQHIGKRHACSPRSHATDGVNRVTGPLPAIRYVFAIAG